MVTFNVMAGVLVGLAATLAPAAQAGTTSATAAQAGTTSATAAPYNSGDQATAMSCPWPDLAPRCSARATSDPVLGVMTGTASVDSGLDGTLAGSGSSEADASLNQNLAHPAGRVARIFFHLEVRSARTARSADGAAYLTLTAGASCDSCVEDGSTVYQFIDTPGPVDLTLLVDPSRVSPGPLPVRVDALALAGVSCGDLLCVTPAGTATAAIDVVLSSITLQP